MAALGADVLFHGNNGTDGVELWISDGTSAGTHELKDIVPGSSGSYPYGLTSAGNHVLFSADTSPNGFNLWTSDGTAAGTYELSSTAYSPSSFTTFTTTACFAAGTRILTEHGPVTVESLAVGDRVITQDGVWEPIVWIGRRPTNCEGHPKPETVWPVWIRAGAFGANVPVRDLYLSPDHAVFVNGVLVPVKLLINGTSIAQVKRAKVTYFHVELPRHAVILAEGLTVESYLDIGDRKNFHQHGATIRLFPDFAGPLAPGSALAWETGGAAPLVMTGEELLKAQRLVGAHVSRRTSRSGATIAFGRRLPAGRFG
jgi:ELWxxDGT repeat protein